MPFIAGAMTIGAGLSFAGGRSNTKKMLKEQKAWRILQTKQLNFAKERWSHYRDTYGDLEQMMVADAMEGVKGDFTGVADRAASDVESAYASQEDRQERQMMALGIDPSSGRFVSADRRMGLDLARTSALAQNTARTNEKRRADTETWQRRYGVGTFGANMMQQAGRDVDNAMESMGRMHQSNAGTYGNLASNLFMQAGQMGMYGALKFGDWAKGRQPQPDVGLDFDAYASPPAADYGPEGTIFNSGLDGFGTDAMNMNDLWNSSGANL